MIAASDEGDQSADSKLLAEIVFIEFDPPGFWTAITGVPTSDSLSPSDGPFVEWTALGEDANA